MDLILRWRRQKQQVAELLSGHSIEVPQRVAPRATQTAKASFAHIEGFEKDYPAFLVALAASIRTGLDPLSAMVGLRELFPQKTVLGRQLAMAAGVIESGGTEGDAIAAFGADVPHPDLPLFRSAFLLARREGSSLGGCLERLAKVTRARQSFRRKTRAAVAMQRMSAFGIAACAGLIAIMQAVANIDALRTAIAHPIGVKLLVGGAGLVAIGLGWMLRLTRTRV